MKWRDIFEKLKNERTVQISYEASLSVELDSIIGDIPVYKFKVQYFKGNNEGLVTECLKTYEELMRLIDKEVAFRRCSHCGELIVGGFISNMELNEDYCGTACMMKAMNQKYGKGNWRFKRAESIIDEDDDTINTDEYQYEVLTNEARMDVFKHMLEAEGKEIELLDNMEPKEDYTVEFVEKTWVPYHMYYCPALSEDAESEEAGEE